jgi:flagellar basal-body rod modification protein FlgD
MAVGSIPQSATNAVSSSNDTSLASALGNNQGLDKNAFLKLLVAQMKNQDPLKPMDNTDFVAQLAQFSNLEQVMGINTRLDTLTAQGQGLQNTEISGLVGKTVSLNGKTVTTDGSGGAAGFSFTLGTPSDSTTITISDSQGNVVRTIDAGPEKAGLVKMAWDGKNDSGTNQLAGSYTVTVAAKSSNGAPIAVTQNATGVVQAVSFDKGYPELQLDNGLDAPVSDLLEVQSTPTTTSSQ